MMKIWKYELDAHECLIEMPEGARIVRVAPQRIGMTLGTYLWALVDPEAPTRIRHFQAINTGMDTPEGGTYIATFEAGAFETDDLIWHLFELEHS